MLRKQSLIPSLSFTGPFAQTKPLVKYTNAHQRHQYLVVCNMGSVIHGVQAVEQAHDSALIEKRNGVKNRATQGALDESIYGALMGAPGCQPVTWISNISKVPAWAERCLQQEAPDFLDYFREGAGLT